MRPASQLFLFADEFHSDIASVFPGNIAFEYDITPTLQKQYVEIRQFVNCLRFKQLIFPRVTVVLNFSEANLTWAKLWNKGCICKLVDKNDYKYLASLSNACTLHDYARGHLSNAYHCLDSVHTKLRSVRGSSVKALKNESDSTFDAYSSCFDDTSQYICQLFDKRFLV